MDNFDSIKSYDVIGDYYESFTTLERDDLYGDYVQMQDYLKLLEAYKNLLEQVNQQKSLLENCVDVLGACQ